MSNSKNNIAWSKLFDKYKIPEKINSHGFFEINSFEINEFREARLMTKFDFKSQLPKIFSDNSFSILPISRGGYIISDINTFHNFENNEIDIEHVNFPSYLESIDINKITSESTALNCAYVSGIIENFVQDSDLKPTVSGRMSSLSFNFNIDSRNSLLNINVNNSQIEIDGGYEGVESLSLIEVKNSISDDFLIRQLFYPYKLWKNKVQKNIKNLFLTYSNGVFHFREYIFENPNHYNSLKLIKEKKYIIRDGVINLEIIQIIIHNVTILSEPNNVPFPQANSFERVINLCELLFENEELDKEFITDNYDFNERQTNYYTDAARYLGLVDKKIKSNKIIYFLTEKGKVLFEISIFERQKELIKLILSHLAFYKTLDYYFKSGLPPDKDQIVEIMKESNLLNIKTDTTFRRRASTVLSWINWILDQVEE